MILVTGGTGFLGSHVLHELIKSGKDIRCIYRKRILSNVPVQLAKYVDWQPADLSDIHSLEEVLDGVNEVYHCAGMVSFNPEDRDLMYQTNVTGTANLVNACLDKGVKKFIHVSSVAALGRIVPGACIDENYEWQNTKKNSFYATTKHDGEMEVWRGLAEGLPAVIVNPSILIGKSLGWTDAFSQLIKKCYQGFPWYTAGTNGFVNVGDVARAMVQLPEQHITGKRFILNGENWSYEKLFRTMHHYLQTNVKLKYAAPWMGEIIWRIEKLKSWLFRQTPAVTRETAKTAAIEICYENDKIKQALPGFSFTSLEDTIADTCQAFLESRQRAQTPMSLYESNLFS